MRVPLVALALLLVVTGVLWLVDSLAHEGEVLTGVRVGDTEVGGVSDSTARQRIGTAADQRLARPLAWRVEETRGEVTPADLGMGVDEGAAADRAMSVGRSGNPLTRFVDWARARTVGITIPLAADSDRRALRLWIDSISFPAKAAAVEPVVDFEGTRPVLTPGVPGTAIDFETTESRLLRASMEDAPGTVSLRTVSVPPRYTDTEASDSAAEAARTLLSGPVDVTLEPARTTLTAEELGSLLRSVPGPAAFEFAVDRDAALALLRPRFSQVGTPPVDAEFTVVGNTVQIVRGKMGVGCCGPGTENLLLDTMRVTDQVGRVANLPQGEVPPDTTSEDLAALGVEDKLAEFTTEHPDGQPRVQNIHKIADMVRGTVVMPGEQYSVNKAIGRRTEAKGWVNAPTIVEGEMTPTPGGGISQFATTLYNALYFSGIQIDEHKPHTKYISRYPKGREATLGYPSPDLVFTNDTPGAVLIWTSYTEKSITVSLWGTADGRKAAASEPQVTEQGECEIVKVTRTITYSDGSTKVEPYTQKYCP